MRTHLGCTGSVLLGALGEQTQRRLELVEASWLEFSPDAAALVVRHVQPDDTPALREIAGELVEFLNHVPEAERARIPGGNLYYQDEETGQYVRLKVWEAGFLTIAWARPDYDHAKWEEYRGAPVPLVFEPFQRLNGAVRFEGSPTAAEEVRSVLERCAGLYSQGDYRITSSLDRVEVELRDSNTSALALVKALLAVAKPGTLEGEIDVSSFRVGDLEDYGRFSFGAGDAWLVRPSLWSDAPETRPGPPLKRAA